jgi:predicted nucleic acid-binding protein
MRVASDTSPISNLAIIGHLELLKRRYGAVEQLLHARQTGMLLNLRSEINRLRSEAGFFVDAEIERFILSQVGD